MTWPWLIAISAASFVAMEGVSYAAHRWLMHGPGMRWHRSHHAPRVGRWEANDVFPVAFSAVGFGLFLAAALSESSGLRAAAIGITAYGLAYLVVHDVHIHERVRVRVPDSRYLVWVREAHRIHHLFGDEPYGMLLPVVSSALRDRARRRASGGAPDGEASRRSSTRRTRNRL